ncbi:MAG TPA: NifB/NifX family molybdenum-iron cluster-binding protein [Patescibacteria group bacterium]|nr:NifB/NifX family molybdenum-iron cluster-binding protein [Patescibacteria group bacterium]
MKVAISSNGDNIENVVSDVFGRCQYFIVVEIKNGKTEEIEVIKNESLDQNSAAGVSTAQLIVEKDVNAVITGNIGPKALDVLKQFDIEIYSGKGIIKDVLSAFIDKKLKKIN